MSDKTNIKRAFGQRLKKLLIKMGMTQTDLAKAAAKFVPDAKFGRDLVSSYVNGRYLPNAVNLAAMAQALKVSADELLPQPKQLPWKISPHEKGKVRLQVDAIVSHSLAAKIAKLLDED